MHKISVVNNKERIDILINKSKFICGEGYERKDIITNVIVNYFDKTSISDFSKENQTASMLYFDDSPLRIADFEFYNVHPKFNFDSDIKLGTKSLSLAFVNALLDNVEYNEDFQLINSLLASLLDDVSSELDMNLEPFISMELTKKALIKLISFSFLNEGLEINNYDLCLKERIKLQINMIKRITAQSKKQSIILIETPIIDTDILGYIEQINGYVIVVFDKINVRKPELDYLFVSGSKYIDISNDNLIFEECNNSNTYLTIREMKDKIINDHLVKIIYN